MKNAPAIIMMILPDVAFAKPVYVRNSVKLLEIKSVNPMTEYGFYGF